MEIIGEIVNAYFSGPREKWPSAKSLMLTSRTTLYHCRQHVHRKFHAKPSTDLEECEETFTRLGLFRYVRELSIDGMITTFCDVDDPPIGLDPDGFPDHTWLDEMVPLLRKFTNVRCLSLDRISWGHFKPETRRFFIDELCKNITDLCLSYSDLRNTNQMLQILQSCSSAGLKSLTFHAITTSIFNHTPCQIAPTAPLSLKELVVKSDSPCDRRHVTLAQWLMGSRQAVKVENMILSWPGQDISTLIKLLEVASPSLKRLACNAFINPSHICCSKSIRCLLLSYFYVISCQVTNLGATFLIGTTPKGGWTTQNGTHTGTTRTGSQSPSTRN